MPSITITHGDGSTETIPKTVGWTRKREIGKMRRVTIDVLRADAQAVTLDPKTDKIALGSIDTVRLVDVETGGSTWRLICYSFEWDANRVTPTDGGNLRQGDDQSLITGLVGEVGTWSAGTINSFTGGLSFVLNHAYRHEALRRIERNAPGEIQFRDEGTVDYLQRLGSDKSASVTLSAANGNIEDEIQITNRGRELDGTHIRVLGAHEGEAQLFANLVPSTDPATYENRVNYTTSRWSSGDTRDWDRWQNKDVTDQATIEEEAAALGEEITEELVEAKATVSGEDLSVGDTVHVTKTDADLNRDMRIHRIKTVSTGSKVVDEVLLSTRTVARQDDADRMRDIQRFNTAFQGSAVWGTVSGGRQPVSATNNYEFSFFYPDIEFEHTAEVQVKGTNYRAYSKGTSVVETTNFDVIRSDFLSGTETLTPGDSKTYTLTVPSVGTDGYEGGLVEPTIEYDTDDNNLPSGPIDIQVLAGQYKHNTTTTPIGNYALRIPDWELQPGDSPAFTVTNEGSEDWVLGAGTGMQLVERQHEHGIEAGVIDFDGSQASPAHYPENCDVLVNGTSQGTSFGDGTGEFEDTVDVSGALTKGAWNTIEITSDGLGHIIGAVGIDAYRQIGTQ